MTKVLRLTEPAAEPISLADAKAHLRVDGSDEDDYINSLISAARARAEDFCNRAFAEATFAVLYDGDLPVGETPVCVPMPEATVDAIAYTDTSGAVQTFSDYSYDDERQEITPDDVWPAGENLRVEITAGNGDSPISIAPAARAAMLLYLADMFELRAAHVVGVSYKENPAAESLLMPYRERIGI